MNSAKMKSLIGITPGSIEKYLLLTGWSRDASNIRSKMMHFRSNSEGKLIIAAPATDLVRDYFDRISDLVDFLCAYSGCSEQEIIASLKSAYVDRMQFRIISESTKDGRIPLEYAAQCIQGLKELVLYSACAEERPCPLCARTFNSAKNKMEKFQFEQTEVGSFIFNVGVRVAEEENEQYYIADVAPLPDPPAEHRVVKRIETAMSQINDVVDKRVRVSTLVEYAFEDGITANMCDAFLKLQPESEDIKLETTIHYAEALTRAVVRPVVSTFERIHFMYIDDISKRYKDSTIIEDADLVGVINMLSKGQRSQDDSTEESENTVRLITRIGQRLRTVNLHLTPEKYALACDAHRDDKEVEVSGTIDKSKKYWFFSEIRSFKVLN